MAAAGAVAAIIAGRSNAESASVVASLFQPPSIVRFNSEKEAFDIVGKAASKVFNAYKFLDFANGNLIYIDEGGNELISSSIRGRVVGGSFVVALDYGNFYEGVNFEVWLIAYYVNESMLSKFLSK